MMNRIIGALTSALEKIAEIAENKYQEMKEQSARKREIAAMEQAAQYRQAIAHQFEEPVKEQLAEAFEILRAYYSLPVIAPAMIAPTFINIDRNMQYWDFCLWLPKHTAISLKSSENMVLEQCNQIFINLHKKALKSFEKEIFMLENSKLSYGERNLEYRQYFANHCHQLYYNRLTALEVKQDKLVGNMVLIEMPVLQQFSPQQVYWVDVAPPQQRAP